MRETLVPHCWSDLDQEYRHFHLHCPVNYTKAQITGEWCNWENSTYNKAPSPDTSKLPRRGSQTPKIETCFADQAFKF